MPHYCRQSYLHFATWLVGCLEVQVQRQRLVKSWNMLVKVTRGTVWDTVSEPQLPSGATNGFKKTDSKTSLVHAGTVRLNSTPAGLNVQNICVVTCVAFVPLTQRVLLSYDQISFEFLVKRLRLFHQSVPGELASGIVWDCTFKHCGSGDNEWKSIRCWRGSCERPRHVCCVLVC